MRRDLLLTWMFATSCLWGVRSVGADDSEIDFGRQVRPILARHCYKCHGPDPEARESGLRLDRAAAATADLGGYQAIKPGDPADSELIARITSEDPDLRMPPSDVEERLSDLEIATLKKWIAEGAVYDQHWSFTPPQAPPVPHAERPQWCAQVIDRFILRRIEQAGLSPNPQASPEALMRRLYLDLTGTTPTPEAVDRYLSDSHPNAYRRLVDRLLASPEYAERFARPWLDLARYSDTNGYEKDRPRSIWPYRDWVISAIAADMPYDEFSVTQLAGDMLPGATNQDRIATGFHRNTMLNEEGGIDPLEYRFYALVDRVATTGTVWLGLTTGCAQCHTHKYDPITHTDYYSLMALLNQADEPDVIVQDESLQAERLRIEREIDAMEDRLIAEHLPTLEQFRSGTTTKSSVANDFVTWASEQAQQARRWKSLAPSEMSTTMPTLTLLPDDSILASGDSTKRDVYRLEFELPQSQIGATAIRLEVLPHDSLPDGGPGMAFYEGRRGDFFLSELDVSLDGEPLELTDPSHSFGKISVGSGKADAANVIDDRGSTGWSTSGAEGQANQWVANFEDPISRSGTLAIELLFERHFAASLGHFRISLTHGAAPVAASKLPAALYNWYVEGGVTDVTPEDYYLLQKAFVRTSPKLAKQRGPIEQLEKQIPTSVRTLGFRERDPEHARTTHRHHRGEYLQTREMVEPAVPSVFAPQGNDQPANRLELARWLVSEQNPLVARVTVNRAWRQFFGTGIVDTAGDYGTQSEPPSHPNLLDWLAVDLREGGWSLKRLHRQIVLSSTYRQSIGEPDASDPRNRLLAVFPHRRLSAEQIRDALMSAAGLLTRQVGGPSVYPPQPASVNQMAYGEPAWKTSQGADRYRRSLYTFSKRTAPFAAFTTFDGPSGEVCQARRQRSTTPLQALTLLNDEMYLEFARAMAEETQRELGNDAQPAEIAARLFRRLLVRAPEPAELTAILDFYQQQVDQPNPWMLVARALMNTDEAITTP